MATTTITPGVEPHVDLYTGTRVTLTTKKPFDDVLAAARTSCTPAPIKTLVQTIADAPDLSNDAPGGTANRFYILFEFEHFTWYNLYKLKGAPIRVRKLLVGNPHALSKAMKIDPAAAVRAPIDVLMFEEKSEETGEVVGTRITWCTPSSILSTDKERAAITEVLKDSDTRLQKLIEGWIA